MTRSPAFRWLDLRIPVQSALAGWGGVRKEGGTKRTLLRESLPALRSIVLAGAALGAAACASDFAVLTARDPSVKFPAGATYALRVVPPAERQAGELDARVNNAGLHDRIQQAIETVLAEKGFRKVEAAHAEFLVEYRVGLLGTLRQAALFNAGSGGAPVAQSPSAYTGGKYGPQPVAEIPAETTKAEILITIEAPRSSRIAYRAMGVDEDVMRGDGSEQAIVKMVTALLKDLP